MDAYVNFLSHLPLSENGRAITYLYHAREEIIEGLNRSDFKIDTFDEQKEGVPVYQKVA